MAYRQTDIRKRALKEEQRKSAGLLSEKFPTVSSIVINLSSTHKAAHPILMKRTVYFYPDTYAYFHIDCMTKNCENGGYDLTNVVGNLIKKKGGTGEGEMICGGKVPDLSDGHSGISYKIRIKYKK